MTKALSIKDIARLAGVSTATVSKVLNQKDQDIGEETKQKIIKIVQETNYVPYQKVIQRMAAKTGAIGLVLPGVSDSFSQVFIRGVEECAYREKGVSFWG
ncbi:LacI family DNA-binding transcriptional regulator [Paenibacillus sp. CC-CFT747]|nr:LacI family DNA-binding transcriptional regulator [Paenibacillus sp. CC-CFT747]